MKCTTCGAPSAVMVSREQPEQHRIELSRVCELGHRFTTVEVPLTMLADKRELTCALRNIDRRIARFVRDSAIAEDPRPVKEVAAAYNLTDARVRQIRASFPDRESHDRFAKIASNLERKFDGTPC